MARLHSVDLAFETCHPRHVSNAKMRRSSCLLVDWLAHFTTLAFLRVVENYNSPVSLVLLASKSVWYLRKLLHSHSCCTDADTSLQDGQVKTDASPNEVLLIHEGAPFGLLP